MANASPKQQIVQSVKDVTNILVTVSTDPSVDELSAALGLTIFLNALGKHATAVFSGKVPPAITFLEPDKTFEETADSLRDFIIALDKEKADHLRYKVVDDAVKIFITPYRTTISEQDLEFSQGDYNIELVLALNVESSEHLDAALEAHGKIFHDATITTITSGSIKSTLGVADWHDATASGVSEMLVELIDELKTPKATLDEQMATALLTGIVSTTERFSNDLTSSKTMNAAAELMAAGANQQLIAVQLEEQAGEENATDMSVQPVDEASDNASMQLDEGKTAKVNRKSKKVSKPEKKKEDDGTLSISHEKKGDVDEVARQTRDEQQQEAARAAQAHLNTISSQEITEEVSTSTPEPVAEVAVEPAPLADLPPVVTQPAPTPEPVSIEPQFEAAPMPGESAHVVEKSVAAASDLAQPTIGGTLNATTELAAEDKRREIAGEKNKTILRHGGTYAAGEPTMGDAPLNAAMGQSDEPPAVDVFSAPPNTSTPTSETPVLSALQADTNALATSPQDARNEVDAALAAVPQTPASHIPTLADIEANQGLPPLPDFSTLPPPPPMPVGTVPDGIPSLGGIPPMVQQPDQQPQTASTPAQPAFSQPQQEFNPGQFQIPG